MLETETTTFPEGKIRRWREHVDAEWIYFAVPAGPIERPIRCASELEAKLKLGVAIGAMVDGNERGKIYKAGPWDFVVVGDGVLKRFTTLQAAREVLGKEYKKPLKARKRK